MSARAKQNLHGDRQPHARSVLLIIDMLSDFDFPDGEKLARRAEPVAARIAELRERLRRHRVPVIFANDNLGRWQSNRPDLLARCHAGIREQLRPQDDDYFLFKPKHSAFFQTPLELILRDLHARRLILTGATLSQCVLFTAADARMRNYEVVVPLECVADISAGLEKRARRYLSEIVGARCISSRSVLSARN